MSTRSRLAFIAFCSVVASRCLGAQPAPATCAQLETAVRANHNDLDAAVALGRCVVRDEQIILAGGDLSRPSFRSSWATAVRELRHAVRTNPALATAYRPLMRMLFAEMRDGCDYASGVCAFVAPITRDGDSLITMPRRVVLNESPDTYELVRRESRPSRLANLGEARELATAWAAVAPNDYRPHQYIGQAELGLGHYDDAADELERAASLGTPQSRRQFFWDRIEALVKSDRGSDARRVVDEASTDPGRDTSRVFESQLSGLEALLGRHRPPPPVDSIVARRERARFDSLIRQSASSPRAPLQPSVATLLAAGDTAAARATLAREDSRIAPNSYWRLASGEGEAIFASAEQHLALGDTAEAEGQFARIEQFFSDAPFRYSPLLRTRGRPWIGGAWLRAGDVLAARGHRDDAIRMYRRVVGLWGGPGADPEVVPVVDSARSRLASLIRDSRQRDR